MVKQLLLSLFTLLMATMVWANVEINETNFPDENFRNWVLAQSYGQDGVLTDDEIAGVKSIDVDGKGIQTLQGIEFFTALTFLSCSDNQLTALDVSQKSALKYLFCYSNQLTALDVSNNTALIMLSCSDNQLTALNVSNNTALTSLSCGYNQLTALDVSQNTALESLYCYDNQLTELDVSQNTALKELSCDVNKLTALDVSLNTALTTLFCYNNQLSALDVSQNTALTKLYCYNNQLTTLDVSQNTALIRLSCFNNQLTTLDLSQNTALNTLVCYKNQINGAAMDALVESLPTVNSGMLYVIYNEDEQNEMTEAQAVTAKAKGWMPKFTLDGKNWLDYDGPDRIRSIDNGQLIIDNEAMYNIAGQRLQKMQKGINIVGGKKILVK